MPDERPQGIELLPPQLTFRCHHCGEAPGESEIGGYFTYPAEDPLKAIDEAGWHVIEARVVCDNCAYEHHRDDA